MLKCTLTAAVSAAVLSLPVTTQAATIMVDPGDPLMTPEQTQISVMPQEPGDHPPAQQDKRVEAMNTAQDKPERETEAAIAESSTAPAVEAQSVQEKALSGADQTPAAPTAAELKVSHEKLRQMSPEERHKFMRAQDKKLRAQLQQEAPAIPAPPAPPAPPEALAAPLAIPAPPPPPGALTGTSDTPAGHREAPGDAPLGAMPLAERQAYFNRRYQELRERARQEGVDLPQRPAWSGRGMGRQFMSDEERAAHREAVRNMTPEQREAYRMGHYQAMRERAAEAGLEMPETPPWQAVREEMQARQKAWADKLSEYRDRVNNLTPEDREAVQALGRMELQRRMDRLMREMQARAAARPEMTPEAPYYPSTPYGQGYPVQPESGYGYPQPPAYDQGYGPANPWGYGR